MVQQARLPWEEQKAQESEPRRREPRAYRPWQIDEQTRRAARKGLAAARKALEHTQQTPADAA